MSQIVHLTCQNCGQKRDVPIDAFADGTRVICYLCGYVLAVATATYLTLQPSRSFQ